MTESASDRGSLQRGPVGGDTAWQLMQAMSDPARAGDVVKVDAEGTNSSTEYGLESSSLPLVLSALLKSARCT